MWGDMQRVPDPANLLNGTRLGGWRTFGKLGQGGYGAVYHVRSTRRPSHKGALKLALEPGKVALRLEREKELLEQVTHPHVVRLLDSGYWQPLPWQEPLPFLVMEYVEGTHLYAWAAQRNPRVREALVLLRNSARALQAIHAANAVNRDVKGENLLVGEDGRLVLVDLGVGDYVGAETLTDSRLPPGTPRYRSPEALRFQQEHLDDFETRYDFRPSDDLYALGVTAYRLLTDEFPFEDENPRAPPLSLLESRPPEAPCVLNPRVPRAVSDLVLRLLAIQPEARPTSARQVAEELDTFLRPVSRELDEHLFAWDDEPSPHSQTSDNQGKKGPEAPGHALLDDAPLRQLELRYQRLRRRRPRVLLSRAEAMRALALRWLPGHATVLVTASVLLVLLGAGFATSLHFLSYASQQKGTPMHESKSSTPTTQVLELLAAVVCLVIPGGCASVPVNSTGPRDCPPEALAAMKERGLEPDDWAYIQVDLDQQGGASEYGLYREGPIVSGYTMMESTRLLPAGTKLYGHLWIGKEKTHIHWNRAVLPAGTELPVCAVLGYNEQGGYPLKPGPEPGVVIISKQAPMRITRHFVRPE